MTRRSTGLPGVIVRQRWSWLCLAVLASLAAASLGDAIQINGRFRQATAMLLGGSGGAPSAVETIPGYSAVLQRQPIQGIRSPQGLSYKANSRTLLTVLENEQAIVELDLCGTVLRRIPVNTEHPLEEVTALGDETVLLSFANTNRISLLTLPRGEDPVDTSTGLHLDVRQGGTSIEAEEIAWNPATEQLFLASKDYPPRIYTSEFALSEWLRRTKGSYTLQAREWLSSQKILAFMPDITSLAYSQSRRKLLFLSDETREILAVDDGGQPRLYLQLEKGSAGLDEKIRSPEGMAVAGDGSLYLISDPANVYLYRFYPQPGLTRQIACSGT